MSDDQWAATNAPDGRVYYYNKTTKETSWTMPPSMAAAAAATATAATTAQQTPTAAAATTTTTTNGVSDASSSSAWREYTAPDGRKYYHNATTQQTLWNKPAELMAAEQPQSQAQQATQSSLQTAQKIDELPKADESAASRAANGSAAASVAPRLADSNHVVTAPTASTGTGMMGRIAADAPPPATPAEEFKKLLNDCGVMCHWDWDRALRAVVTDQRYAVINSLAEKKKIFLEYVGEQRERERRDLVSAKMRLRDEFVALLASHKLVDAQTEWRQAAIVLADEPAFLAIVDPDERQFFFEEYQIESAKLARDKEQVARDALVDTAADSVIALAYADAQQTPPARRRRRPARRPRAAASAIVPRYCCALCQRRRHRSVRAVELARAVGRARQGGLCARATHRNVASCARPRTARPRAPQSRCVSHAVGRGRQGRAHHAIHQVGRLCRSLQRRRASHRRSVAKRLAAGRDV
jgi:hypothetical protein